MLDIHSHIKYDGQSYDINSILNDMADHNITQRVISSVNGLTDMVNNQNINDIVAKYPDQLIGCAIINPKNINAVEATVASLNLEHIKMFEFNSFEHGYYPDTNDNMEIIIELIAEKGLPVKVFTGISSYAIPQQWEKYVEKYPHIKFVFLHMGCFDYGYSCIEVVARHSNAYVELSNQYELQILRKSLKELDTSKILFGTTYPERLTSSALLVFDMLDIPEETIEQIYKLNASKELEIG